MVTDFSVAEFFEVHQQTKYALGPSQLEPLRKALEDHSAPLAPLAAEMARPILDANERRQQGVDTGEYHYQFLWRMLAAAIRRMPSQIDRIVDLVVALHRVPDPTGYMADGQDMREEWNEFACQFVPPEPSSAPDAATRRQARLGWMHLNAFNAKLSTVGVAQLDQRGRAGHVFRVALEETPWDVYHVEWMEKSMDEDGDDREDPDVIAWRENELAKRDVRKLNYWVPAAAAWIEHDGPGLYATDEPMRKSAVEPSVWTGSEQFSKERFALWSERFVWASRVTALEQDTRQRAAKAATVMQQIIEKGGKA